MTRKLKVAYHRYTSCGGCQLTLVNCERELALLEEHLDIVEFPFVSSVNDPACSLDVALAEGSISTLEELERVLALRRRATFLIAVGACALNGGVNLLGKDRDTVLSEIYGPGGLAMTTFPPQPLFHFVRIDAEISGCPPEGGDYLRHFGALVLGGFPEEWNVPVCMDCRMRENRCLLIEGRQPCFGPVTRGGCQARCPSFGSVCEGCRGVIPEANIPEQVHLLQQTALSADEIEHRLERFLRRKSEGH